MSDFTSMSNSRLSAWVQVRMADPRRLGEAELAELEVALTEVFRRYSALERTTTNGSHRTPH